MPEMETGEGQAAWQSPGDRTALRELVRGTLTRLSRTGELPALPPAATAALAIARDPNAGVEGLCQVIRADVGLSARILRVANSAAYARRIPARTLAEAVLTLGLRKTCDLLVAAGARQLFRQVPGHAERLWNHALVVALLCEEIARETRATEPHFAFLPGLFHDVGRIAFLLAADDAFHAVADRSGTTADAERAWYGFDHAEAGAILVEDWGLAPDQVDAIRWHHQPSQAERGRLLAAALNVADAEAFGMGFGGGKTAPVGTAGVAVLGLAQEATGRAVARANAAFSAHHDFLV